jgi:hypothetical protein
MPLGYGYLTRHLPHKATHTRLSGSASRQASHGARNEGETRLHAQIPRCSDPDSHNEHTPALKVPLQTELRFHSHGYELPPHQRACGTTNFRWLTADHYCSSVNDLRLGRQDSCSDDLSANAAAGGPSPTPPHEGRGQAVKTEESEVRPQVALTISSSEKPSLAATTSVPTTAATCPPTPHQRASAAPKRTGRSSLPFSPQERERDHPRTRVPPSRRTTCCATPRCTRPQSPGRRTECCTLAGQQQFAFPRMARGRLLRRARGWFPPPDAEGRSGSPAHAKAGPGSPRPPPQQG